MLASAASLASWLTALSVRSCRCPLLHVPLTCTPQWTREAVLTLGADGDPGQGSPTACPGLRSRKGAELEPKP